MSPRLRIAGLISILLHLLIVAGFLLFQRRSVPLAEAPDTPAVVELVMQEQKGSGQTVVNPPAPPPAQPRPETAPTPAPKPPEVGEPAPSPAATPPSPPTPPAPSAEAAAATPPNHVPQINIGGTDSESNAVVTGGRDIIPGSPDNKARNRPPVYPDEAARLGQQGAVLIVVHVGPSGLPSGVAIERSSGYAMLDKAAENAVMKWTFQPATKDGLPVPFDFYMNFTFAFQ